MLTNTDRLCEVDHGMGVRRSAESRAESAISGSQRLPLKVIPTASKGNLYIEAFPARTLSSRGFLSAWAGATHVQ